MIFLSFNTRFVYKVEKQVENLAIIQQHTFCMPQGTSNYRVYASNSGLFTIKQLYKMNILYNSGHNKRRTANNSFACLFRITAKPLITLVIAVLLTKYLFCKIARFFTQNAVCNTLASIILSKMFSLVNNICKSV